MKKNVHCFMNKMVMKNVTSISLLIVSLYLINQFNQISGSLFVLYRKLEKDEKTYPFLNVNILVLKVWINLPGSSMCKVPSIIPDEFHWSTGVQSIHVSVVKRSRDMSLILVARLINICQVADYYSNSLFPGYNITTPTMSKGKNFTPRGITSHYP